MSNSTAKRPRTAKEVSEFVGITISPQYLGAIRRQSRRTAGPPFRYSLDFPPPVYTPEEWAEIEAQAEFEDDMGLPLGRGDDEEGCVRLAAQNLEDAKAEAEHLWQTEPHEGAIGYAVYSRDWSCKHAYHIDRDNLVMMDDVRAGQA
jgi:hypothetical protein